MLINIYYFSGSGNSLKVSKDLSKELNFSTIIPIPKAINQNIDNNVDAIGIVFPVFAWGVPKIVKKFIETIKTNKYVFIVLTKYMISANTLIKTENILRTNGVKLSAGFEIRMPESYFPAIGAISEKSQRRLFEKEIEKIKEIVNVVQQQKIIDIKKNNSIFKWFLSDIMYNFHLKRFSDYDKNFWTDKNCNSCGICAKVCPVKNIEFKSGLPFWLHNCESCMACLQWCPQQSIQYGKISNKRKRYKNPDIHLNEMILW